MNSDITPGMSFHFCQSIEGALKNWTKREWRIVASDNSMSVKELQNYFKTCLAEGKRVLPMNDCDNFCYQNGCLGHSQKVEQKLKGES